MVINKYEMNQATVLTVDHTFYENAANLIAESRKMVASTANTVISVSYTHLDVYKRQGLWGADQTKG